MRVVIEKSKWDRGKGLGKGALFNGQTYCALGFCLKACGVSDDLLKGNGSIGDLLSEAVENIPAPFIETYADGFQTSSDLALKIAATNDVGYCTDAERMERLSLFLEPVGFDLEFVE